MVDSTVVKPAFVKPWKLAVLTFIVALMPVCLAWKNYCAESQRKDSQLFDATSGLVGERLQLQLVRHFNLFNILRNQLRGQQVFAGDSLRIPPALRASYPHLIAFGYAATDGNRVKLQWTSADYSAPVEAGTDLSESVHMAGFFERAGRSPSAIAEVDSALRDRVIIAVPVGEAGHPRGFLVGWVSIASLCADAGLPLLRQEVIKASPLAENAAVPAEARVFTIREVASEFPLVLTRGPKFSATYGQVAPSIFLAAGLVCAFLLAFLVFQASHAGRIRAALDAERMRSRLVQGFSHEFRTPLSVILSSADLLSAYGAQLDVERKERAITEIQLAAQRLSEMVGEILQLSRLESQSMQPRPSRLELRPFCESLARSVAVAWNDRSKVMVSADGVAVLDGTLLRGVLENLLSNAMKYGPAQSEVRLSAVQRDGQLIFTVVDRGIGIPSADLPRLGEPFHRAANVGETPGTGLGLAIAHRSASLLGGQLHIESREGAGTTATLTLPVK